MQPLLNDIDNYLNKAIVQIRANIKRNDKIATWSAYKNIKLHSFESTSQIRAFITVVPYFENLEQGTKPKALGGGVDKPYYLFRWAKAKGLPYRDENGRNFVFRTWYKINDFGDKLYRSGGKKNIYTPVLQTAKKDVYLLVKREINKVLKTVKISSI